MLAISDLGATFGLVLVFFIILPFLAQGLIGFAIAQALGERAENERYLAEHGADHRRD